MALMDEINIPVFGTGTMNSFIYEQVLLTFPFVILALLIFFFCNEGFEKQDGSRFSLLALDALKNVY
jgi:hypothetical protein